MRRRHHVTLPPPPPPPRTRTSPLSLPENWRSLIKPHGLYFSANITDTTQTSQEENEFKWNPGLLTDSGNEKG